MGAIWKDGRSGPVGRLIGQWALDEIQERVGELNSWKGVVFRREDLVVIGRTAQEAYTRSGGNDCAMWANVSRSQIEEIRKVFPNVEIKFLLVSVADDLTFLRIWLLPQDVVRRFVFDSTVQKKITDQHVLKICGDPQKWIVGNGDVTEFYTEVGLDEERMIQLGQVIECEVDESKNKKSSKKRSKENNESVVQDFENRTIPFALVLDILGKSVDISGNVTIH